MRGRGQAAPEQRGREGRTCEAGAGQQQGGPGRGPRRGQLPGDPGAGGHPARVVRHKPQEVVEPAGWGRWRGWWGHGTPILLLITVEL